MSPIVRILAAIAGLAILVFLFWIGLFVVLALTAVGVGLAVINAIKMKLTGRPLFASRFKRQFDEARRQSERYRKRDRGNVIEGEIVDRDEDPDRRD